jgi:hypothetical protein
MILFCELGKSRLWAGQPLVIATRVEFEPAMDDEPPNSSFAVSVYFRAVDAESEEWQKATPLDVGLPPGVTAIETLDIAPGAYELLVEHSGATTAIPETVWILSRADYRALLRSEASESFEFEPIVSNAAELTWMLNQNAARVWSGFQSPFQVSWSSDGIPISYAPLQWISETMMRALKYVSAFGIQNLTGFVSIAGPLLEIGVSMDFLYPIPDAISVTFQDAECSDLHMLNANGDLGEFDMQIEIQYGRGRIAVRQRVPELEYA